MQPQPGEVTTSLLKPMAWADSACDDHDAALRQWHLIVSLNLRASRLGRIIAAEGENSEVAQQAARDALYPKATATLRRRAGSLFAFFAWRRRSGLFGPGVPFAAREARQYLERLRAEHAPASRGASFMEAVAFALHVIRMDGGK